MPTLVNQSRACIVNILVFVPVIEACVTGPLPLLPVSVDCLFMSRVYGEIIIFTSKVKDTKPETKDNGRTLQRREREQRYLQQQQELIKKYRLKRQQNQAKEQKVDYYIKPHVDVDGMLHACVLNQTNMHTQSPNLSHKGYPYIIIGTLLRP